jgi:hypothetical protein
LAVTVWSILDTSTEIIDVGKLLQSRFAAATDDRQKTNTEKLATAMVGSIVNKLNGMGRISASDAMSLNEAVEVSSLPRLHKDTIAEAIDRHLTTASDQQVGQCDEARGHKLKFIQNYLIASEWAELKATDATYWRRMNIIVTRLRLCGVKFLAEETVRWGVALVAVLTTTRSGKMPSHTLIWNMQQEFKQCFHSCSAPVVSKGLKMYPQFPKDLPQGIYDAAYTKEDPPIDMEVDQLELVGKRHVPMRSNSKLLRGDSSGAG